MLIEHVMCKLAIERSDWTHPFLVMLHKYVLLGRPDFFYFLGGAYKRVGDTRLPVPCVISIIIDGPAVSCTPKQIDLQAFLLLQLPYCGNVFNLLLTSRCKSAAAQYKCCYYLVPPPSILTKQI